MELGRGFGDRQNSIQVYTDPSCQIPASRNEPVILFGHSVAVLLSPRPLKPKKAKILLYLTGFLLQSGKFLPCMPRGISKYELIGNELPHRKQMGSEGIYLVDSVTLAFSGKRRDYVVISPQAGGVLKRTNTCQDLRGYMMYRYE